MRCEYQLMEYFLPDHGHPSNQITAGRRWLIREKEIAILEKKLGVEPEQSAKSDGNGEGKSPAESKDGTSGELKEPSLGVLPLLPKPYQPNSGPKNHLESVEEMLATEFTPPDR